MVFKGSWQADSLRYGRPEVVSLVVLHGWREFWALVAGDRRIRIEV
jgi:hypothetical protein